MYIFKDNICNNIRILSNLNQHVKFEFRTTINTMNPPSHCVLSARHYALLKRYQTVPAPKDLRIKLGTDQYMQNINPHPKTVPPTSNL